MNLAPFLYFLYRKRKEKIMSLDGIIGVSERYSVDGIIAVSERYSGEVNSFSFNPKAFVDNMSEAEREKFGLISKYFVWILAQREYYDGRNEAAVKKAKAFMKRHAEMNPKTEILICDIPIWKIQVGHPFSRSKLEQYLLMGQYDGHSSETLIALCMASDHPTLQQTFCQAALYELMVETGEKDNIQYKEYRLPLI